jgi:diadenosine tetraphosphate (Ap4A) HIT family hydrolase
VTISNAPANYTCPICLGVKQVVSDDTLNNELAGDQHAFHYHLHVFPRYNDDGFNEILPKDKRLASPEERAEYAKKLKDSFSI